MNVVGIVMERHATLLECVDARTGEKRHLRLDRIDHAAPEVATALGRAPEQRRS